MVFRLQLVARVVEQVSVNTGMQLRETRATSRYVGARGVAKPSTDAAGRQLITEELPDTKCTDYITLSSVNDGGRGQIQMEGIPPPPPSLSLLIYHRASLRADSRLPAPASILSALPLHPPPCAPASRRPCSRNVSGFLRGDRGRSHCRRQRRAPLQYVSANPLRHKP
jgi:hypothetical protein